MIFLKVQRAGSNRCSSGKRKDAETREKQPRNNSADLGVGPVSPQEIHIFEFFDSTKTPKQKKDISIFHSREGLIISRSISGDHLRPD